MNHFEVLNKINVNDKVEKKSGLTYLSWPFAWAEVKKVYPDAFYIIKRFDGLPYVFDPKTGYMVFTEVTIEGHTHEMWLPVMDGANKSMKDEAYKYTTKYGEKTCDAADMFDINKTIMRCLVKNLAMFGLGLYIYAGEDLPEGGDTKPEPPKKQTKKEREDHANARIEGLCNYHKIDISTFEQYLKTLQDEGKVPAGKVTDMSEKDLGVTISLIHSALNATKQTS